MINGMAKIYPTKRTFCCCMFATLHAIWYWLFASKYQKQRLIVCHWWPTNIDTFAVWCQASIHKSHMDFLHTGVNVPWFLGTAMRLESPDPTHSYTRWSEKTDPFIYELIITKSLPIHILFFTFAFFLVCCVCDTFFIVSVHIQCQASIYTLSLCRGHSWRVRLARLETLTPPGHLVSPLVCRGPWMSTVVLYCCCHSDSASVFLYFTIQYSNTF